MKGYADWDNMQEKEVGEVQRIPAGGYVMRILGAEITMSRNGNEMLNLALEVNEGEYKDYFAERFEQKKGFNADAKWPCIFRQLTRGNSAGYLKRLIGNIERSNQGYSFKANNFDENTLKGKLVGFIFRDEEWEYNSKKDFTAKPYASRTVDDIRNKKFEVPKPLLLDGSKGDTSATSAATSNGNDMIDQSSKYDDMDVPF